MKDYVYSDVNSALKRESKGDIKVEYDGEAVVQSIRNIFSTISGERVRNPIGSVLLRYLFEPMSDDTADDIRTEIIQNIRKYEPRVRTLKVDVKGDRDNHIYIVTIRITIDRFTQPLKFQMNLRSME